MSFPINIAALATTDLSDACTIADCDCVVNCIVTFSSELAAWRRRFLGTFTAGESIAVRIARAFTKKSIILFSGYHGWSDWYLAANITDKRNLNNHLIKDLAPHGVPIELKGTSVAFEYNNLQDLFDKIQQNKSNLAGIVMEPARSAEADASYLKEVRKLAIENSVPLIFDEISSGFRQSKGPYAANFGVTPDMYVFAKSIGNGYPIAAITGSAALMKEFNHSFVSSTNWTEAVGLSAIALSPLPSEHFFCVKIKL